MEKNNLLDGEKSAELAKKLKPRERTFVREYMRDLNGTQAAIRAGYSEKSAASQASRLLRKSEVREYRDALMQEAFEAIGINKYNIVMCIWEIYERCMEKELVEEWSSELHCYVPTGVWQFNAKGALKALDMLRQMLPEMKKDDDASGGGLEEMLMMGAGDGGREF